MSRELAILVFTIFTVWLWREDNKSRPPFSKALWIPLIWLLLLASRPLSWWSWFFLGIGNPSLSDLDGNVLDRVFYSALICLSLVVIMRRGISWSEVFRGNTGLLLFYAFLGLTILWAAYPFPTFKRWTKELGAIPVLLVIITDRNPIEAIKAVFTRCAFVIFTLSVMTIKYIPEISRDYNRHSGLAEVHGICDQKNSLGEAVMVFGLVLVWQLLEYGGGNKARDYLKRPALQWLITLAMGLWLLRQCDSKTSIIGLIVGAALFLTRKIRVLDKRRCIVGVCLIAMPVFILLDNVFHVSQPILNMLGRDATLTNRTEIWAAVKTEPVNRIFGCGYLNFWDIVGPIKLGESEVDLKTAHNGYLEIFLDGGYVGVLFLVIMLMNAGIHHARSFVRDYPAGVFALATFCMLLLTNISESVFARRGPLWSAFLLTTIGYWFLARLPEGTDERLTSENSYDFSTQIETRELVAS